LIRATRLGPSRLALVNALLCALFSLGFLALPLSFRTAVLLSGAFAVIAVVGAIQAFRNPRRDGRTAELSAHAGLSFDGERIDARAARVMGNVVYVDRGWHLPAHRYRVDDRATARKVVEALGLDAGKVRDRFRSRGPGNELASMLLPWVSILLVFAVYRTRHALQIAAPAGILLALVAMVQALGSFVDVGPDGVYLRWLFWTWHVPAARITGVRRAKQGNRGVVLHVEQDKGPPLAVVFGRRPMLREGTPLSDVEAIASAFESRIAELMAARRSGDHSTFARLVEGRSIAELRALGPETFRSAGFSRDDLLSIVEDATAPAGVRARAAIAAGKDPRVRVAAEQTTLPQLRVAFESADDEHAEEALRALDET